MSTCACCRPVDLVRTVKSHFAPSVRAKFHKGRVPFLRDGGERSMGLACGVRASMVESSESSSNFAKRMEQAWLISQQPRPVACSTCNSNGHVECKWCGGTGFFMIGDNMLCHVHSRTATALYVLERDQCAAPCKGTGFRAKWLGEPPIHK